MNRADNPIDTVDLRRLAVALGGPDPAKVGHVRLDRVGQLCGKVVAVHVNYRSRAAERGRPVTETSFFLKPGTSLSTSPTVTCPEGLELFTFEGEIAVVVGSRMRGVTADVAWQGVRGVTASADLGVADLKRVDRGSNVRAKGADGFTPIGPALIPAHGLAPERLRVRTWLGGDLVQDAGSDDLITPIPQVLAELSELITLEPGDVVLTGTPAGGSVARPGDLVEVQVDAGDATSGRLQTRVEQGPPLTRPGLASVTADDRATAWGAAASAPPPPDAPPGLTPELRSRLSGVATATLSSQLRRHGLATVTMDGLLPVPHAGSRHTATVVGTARTLRCVALREDLFAEAGGGFNAQKALFDRVGPGEVIVIAARGEPRAGTLGDILTLRAQGRGAAGIVTDGAVRDSAAIAQLDLPVWSAATHPAVLGRRHVPWEHDVTVTCGGVTVQPGDIVVADADGVVVIPPGMVEQIAADAVEQERQERFITAQVGAGASLDGLYPMNEAWRDRYARWVEQEHPERQE